MTDLINYKISDIHIEDLLDFEVDWEIGGVADPLGQIANWIVNTVGYYINVAVSAIQTGVGGIVNAALGGIQAFISGLTQTVNNIWASIQGITGTISSALSQIISSVQSVLGNVISQIATVVSSLSYSLASGFSTIISSISGVLSNVANVVSSIGSSLYATILSGFNQFVGVLQTFGSTVSQGLTAIGSQILTSISGVVGSISSTLGSIYTQIIGGVQSAFNTIVSFFNGLVSSFSKFANQLNDFTKLFVGGIQAFFKDPFTFIKIAVSTVLKDFGLPTLDEISKGFTKWVDDWWNSKPIQDGLKSVFAFPSEVLDFVKTGTKVFTAFLEKHSSSALENIILMIKAWFGFLKGDEAKTYWGEARKGEHGLASVWISNLYNVDVDKEGNVNMTRNPEASLNPLDAFIPWFKNLSSEIMKGLQAASETVLAGLNAIGNFIVDGLVTTFNLPKPDSTVTDPLGKVANVFMKMMTNLAKVSKSSTPIVTETMLTVTGGITGATLFSEALEYAGLTIDAVHPIKNLQLKDKFEKLTEKIGLKNVSGVIGATLVAASLSPILSRWWNKVSQVQLPNTNQLLAMWHHKLISEYNLNEYMKEHGLDDKFRENFKELSYTIPDIDLITRAYLRFVNDEKITQELANKEIEKYLDLANLRKEPREGFTFSDFQLSQKMLFRGVSRFERRSLNAIGALTQTALENVLRADRLNPDLIKTLAGAERLQGSLAFRNQIASKIAERLQKGFIELGKYKEVMLETEFSVATIGYLTTAHQLDIQTTIDEARLKEADTNYTEGYIEKKTIEKTDTTEAKQGYDEIVKDIIKNETISKQHIAIADIARKRFDQSRVRDEGNLIVQQMYADLTQGATTDKEYTDVATGLGRNTEEIKRTLQAAKLSLAIKVRTARFRTLQTQFAKKQIGSSTFMTRCLALPINKDLVQAAQERILAQIAPKVT